MTHKTCMVASAVCSALGSPLAMTLKEKIESGKWDEVVSAKVHPRLYESSWAYWLDAQACALLKKFPGLPTGIDTRAAALKEWQLCERRNYLTNRRLEPLFWRLEYPLDEDMDDPLLNVLRDFRREVARILGPLKHREIEVRCKITNGTTFSNKGVVGSLLPSKLSKLPEATSQSVGVLSGLNHTLWIRAATDSLWSTGPHQPCALPLVKGNRYATVPKTSVTDRSIAVEPAANLFLQKGIGESIRKRLQTYGQLLTDLTGSLTTSKEIHMDLARRASKGEIDCATLDLSSASDTISYYLVRLLLPEDWFLLMDAARCPFTKVDGKWWKLEKFSSMGNGFTFELETLIFLAILRVIAKSRGMSPSEVYAFGDDMIYPTQLHEDVVSCLTFLGLSPNVEKTFASGPFRESCGGDYFNGVDVRPIHFSKPETGPRYWISVHNKVARLQEKIPVSGVLNQVRSFVPTEVRKCTGPVDCGDTVFHTREWTTRADPKIGPWSRQIKTCLPPTNTVPLEKWDDISAVAAFICGSPSQGVTPRGDDPGYRLKWVTIL